MIERFLAAFLMAKGGLAAPAPAAAQDKPPLSQRLDREPVFITGDRFVIHGKESRATYSGNVKAVRGDATLRCAELVAYYVNGQEVRRLECLGGAEAEQGDKWARGDRADFDNATAVIVVTGAPEARQGASRVTGQKFTIDLTRDSLRGEQVQTVAVPGSGGGGAGLEGASGKLPVQINGELFEVQGSKNTATWTGRVKARRGPTLLTCDRLVATYGDDEQVKRAECLGRATAVDGDKWARGERAVYDVPRGVIVVTGNPQARQNQNHMVGTRFVIDLPGDKISGDNVRAVLNPDDLPRRPKEQQP